MIIFLSTVRGTREAIDLTSWEFDDIGRRQAVQSYNHGIWNPVDRTNR